MKLQLNTNMADNWAALCDVLCSTRGLKDYLFWLTLPSNRLHLSNDDCPEDKRENYRNRSVL